MKRITFTLLVISSAALLVTALQARTRPRYGDTLRADTQTVVMSGDPTPDALAGEVFENLVKADSNGHLQPGLATLWNTNNGGYRWEFYLREGVTFHDGTTFDAAAVVRSFSKVANTPWRVRAGNGSVIFESDTAQPNLPALLSLPEYAIASTNSDGDVAGTGPFSLDKRTGPMFSLKANDDYWGGRPFMDSLELLTSRSLRDQSTDFSFDRADVVELAPEQLRKAQQDRMRLDTSRPSETIFLVFDSAKPELRDIRLRQAVALCVDRAAIRNVIFQHQSEIASGLLPNWLSGYEFLFSSEQDIMHARQLRLEVGQVGALTIGYDSGDLTGRLIAERIALNAHDIGLNLQAVAGTGDLRLRHVDLRSLNAAAALNEIVDRLNLGSPAPSPSADSLYNNERAALQTFSAIPLVHLPRVTVLKDRVRDWTPSPAGTWHLDEVWIARSTRTEVHP